MRRAFLSLVAFDLLVGVLFARVIDRDQALRAAFPGAEIRYSPVFLTDQQRKEIERISGAALTTMLIGRYVVLLNQNEIGRAYLDTHVVRTKKESLLVILNPDGRVRRVETVAFLEPPEYMPSERWYQQFEGKELNEELQVRRGIHAVTGASLTAQATTDAVRRVLAIDELLRHEEQRKQEKQP